VNTLIKIADSMSDEEATLVVTAGTAMYGLTELGGLVAGESVVVIGPGPIGLLGVAVAKALGADPVILTGTREARLAKGASSAPTMSSMSRGRMPSRPCAG
jgi:threonine dehydrogenase-like Zn-dependent dehydrogenase